VTNISSGELRHRVRIEKKSSTLGSRGQALDEWEEVGRMWAKITPMWGGELEVARQRKSNVSVKVITRKNEAAKLDTSYRLLNAGSIYYVAFVNHQADDLSDIHVICSMQES